jgi:hypothetical protein
MTIPRAHSGVALRHILAWFRTVGCGPRLPSTTTLWWLGRSPSCGFEGPTQA